MNYYIVENDSQAYQAINLLNEAAKGKANFFILDSFKEYHPTTGKIFDNAGMMTTSSSPRSSISCTGSSAVRVPISARRRLDNWQGPDDGRAEVERELALSVEARDALEASPE